MDDKKNMSDSGGQNASETGTGRIDSAQDAERAHGQTMPMVTFTTFVLSIASSALVHLGEVPDPETGEQQANLEVAKHNIDILSMLKDKSAGNLDGEETRLIEGVLYELRLKYVMAAQ